MITIYNIKRNILKDNKSYILTELRGLSTDTKPVEIKNNLIDNGSVFIEIDTGKVSLYDITTNSWNEVE